MKVSIEAATTFIAEGNYKIVGLQFPKEFLKDCVSITEALQESLTKNNVSVELHVLADSVFDNVYVDTIAAAHVYADCIIHFGSNSPSEQPKLPTFYAVLREDASTMMHQLRGALDEVQLPIKNVILFLDGSLEKQQADVVHPLENVETECEFQIAERIDLDASLSKDEPLSEKEWNRRFCCGYAWKTDKNFDASCTLCIWMGPKTSRSLFHLQLHMATSQWKMMDPSDEAIQEGLLEGVEISLKRRPYFVEKARKASIVGILVSIVSLDGHLNTINQLQTLAKTAGKEVYEIFVSKPEPTKLANFPEIDAFIAICDPLSMILDCKEYLAPIVTPFEARLAFTESYLSSKQYQYALEPNDLPSKQPSTEQALVERHAMTLGHSQTSAIEDVFQKRHFRGLESTEQQDTQISTILKGRSGTAAGYSDEPGKQLEY